MLPYHPDWSRTSTSTGYKVVYCPDHPRAWITGYIYEHTLLMEISLGRLLGPGEIVHHRNKNRQDNSLPNLELTTRGAHARLHKEDQPKLPEHELVCFLCGKQFTRSRRHSVGPQVFCSKRCAGIRVRDSLKVIPHGTANGYGYHKCRCLLCTQAHTDRLRSWRSKTSL